MVTKKDKILNSDLILQIEPKNTVLARVFYFASLIITLLSLMSVFYLAFKYNCVIYAFLPFVIGLLIYEAYLLLSLKAPLSLTEKGIIKPGLFHLYWEEIVFYNIIDMPRISKKSLYVETNQFPFYHMRFQNVALDLIKRGIFFDETKAKTVDEIFKSKGIKKQR